MKNMRNLLKMADEIEKLGLINIYPKTYNEREFGISLHKYSDEEE